KAMPSPYAALPNAPCPSGYRPIDAGPSLDPGQLERYSDEASFEKKYCEVDPNGSGGGGAGDGGVMIDYASSDLLVIGYPSLQPTPLTLLDAGGTLWFKTDDAQSCSGAAIGWLPGFYVVPKGTEVKIEACVTTCTCNGGPCMFP